MLLEWHHILAELLLTPITQLRMQIKLHPTRGARMSPIGHLEPQPFRPWHIAPPHTGAI
jgi:hypothetical protein